MWSFNKSNNLISKDKFLAFLTSQKFPNYLTMQKTTYLFENEEVIDFCDWNQCFSLKGFETELKEAGFSVNFTYSEANGSPYKEDSPTFFVVAEK